MLRFPSTEAAWRTARRALKALTFRVFLGLDAVGVHLIPKHYYSPVPDHAWLRRNRTTWMRPASLAGIDWDLDAQLDWLATLCGPFYGEVRGLRVYNELAASGFGPGYGPIESQVLHCFIRSHAPRRIVEIGSGVSTLCALRAAHMNASQGRRTSQVICIEPFPTPALRRLGGVTLIAEPAQVVSRSIFDSLEDGDLLFIDSTHSVKVGSEVIRLYLDVVPQLASGVFVHVHDMNLPYPYPHDALTSYFGWQETALVLALLAYNRRLRVCAALSALHHERPAELMRVLADYRPRDSELGVMLASSPNDRHFPSSLWLRAAT